MPFGLTTTGGVEATKASFDPGVQHENGAPRLEAVLRPGWGEDCMRQRDRPGTTKKTHGRCGNSLGKKISSMGKSESISMALDHEWLRHLRLGGGHLLSRAGRRRRYRAGCETFVLGKCARTYSQCP